MPEPRPSDRWLIDNSAYARAADPAVASVWADEVRAEALVACGPFVIEALFSARDAGELSPLIEELTDGLSYLDADAETWRLAREAQLALAEVAPQLHRRPPVDYLIAAMAHQHHLGVLHYDSDYELISQHSALRFEPRWIVPRGSLARSGEDPLRPIRREITARLARFTRADDLPTLERVIAKLDQELEAAEDR